MHGCTMVCHMSRAQLKTLAEVLEAAMVAAGFTAVDLAEQSGVDVTLIRRYLNGTLTETTPANARRMARPLKIDPAVLVFREKAA